MVFEPYSKTGAAGPSTRRFRFGVGDVVYAVFAKGFNLKIERGKIVWREHGFVDGDPDHVRHVGVFDGTSIHAVDDGQEFYATVDEARAEVAREYLRRAASLTEVARRMKQASGAAASGIGMDYDLGSADITSDGESPRA